MATTTVLAQQSYGPGSFAIPSTAIPNSITSATLGIAIGQHTNPAIEVKIIFDLSMDNGATWIGNSTMADCYVGASRFGGVAPIDKNTGLPFTQMSVTRRLPAGTNRRIRGVASITGGSLVTSATLTTLP